MTGQRQEVTRPDFRIGDPFRPSQLRPGVTVERTASPWGFGEGDDARYQTHSPCCGSARRLEWGLYGRYPERDRQGALTSCRGCGWRWKAWLRREGQLTRAWWTSAGPPPGRGWRKGRKFPAPLPASDAEGDQS